MPKLTGRTTAFLGLVLAAGLLFVSIGIGLRVPSETALDPFGTSPSLDYRALRVGGIEPLSGRFIEEELGSVIGGTRSGTQSLGRTDLGRLRSVTADPLTVVHGFCNDDFAEAFAVSTVPFTARTSTVPASRQAAEPGGCGADGGTAWYRYRSPQRIGLLANTFGTAYGTVLGVFVGTDITNLRRVACDNDTSGFSQVAFPAQPGQTYWFQIAGPSGGGRLVFNLTLKGLTTLASVANSGLQGDSDSFLPSISGNGRFVSFYSSSFVTDRPPPCLRNPYFDLCNVTVFLRDRSAHRISNILTPATGPLPVSSPSVTDQTSISGTISADGRYVSFWSGRPDIVPGDTNDTWDVFVLDRQTKRVRRVSTSSSGAQGDGASFNPSISADGRYIAFTSSADNMVPDDTNMTPDVFVHDLRNSKTVRASVGMKGEQGNLLRSTNYPLESGSHLLSISATGRFVLFRSTASNLTAGDGNGFADVFVRDLHRGTTTRVSVGRGGEEADADSRQPVGIAQGAIAANGRFAFFNSNASNLVPGDTNNQEDLFVRDIVKGVTRRVSVSSTGAQSDRGVGASDPFALFIATFTQLTVERQNLSQVAYSATPDGRYVAFSSDATNLVPGDRNNATDVFLRDLFTGNTTLVSLASTGRQSDGASNSPAVSADGRFIAFRSAASNLVPGDTNGQEDVFVYEIPGQREASGWY